MMAALVVFMIAVSFFTKPYYERVQLVDQNDPLVKEKSKTSRLVKFLWAIIAVLMAIVFYVFN
jgi:hypothetical protein